jgi:hypothetical protein
LFFVLDLINHARRWHILHKKNAPPRFPKLLLSFFLVPQTVLVAGLIYKGISQVSLASYATGLLWLLFPCAAQMLSFTRNAEQEVLKEFEQRATSGGKL